MTHTPAHTARTAACTRTRRAVRSALAAASVVAMLAVPAALVQLHAWPAILVLAAALWWAALRRPRR